MMPFQAAIESITKLVNLNESEKSLIVSKMSEVSVKKKAFILSEGQVCQYAHFIRSGCFRYFYNVDGEERTGQFFFEGSWYADFESFITGKPSVETIQAIEDCQLVRLSRQDVLALYDQIPTFERWGRLTAEYAFLGLKSRTSGFLNRSPEERYLDIIRNRPKVIQRIPQRYIASYLGIQPESLSRIRKRLSDQP